MIVDGDEVRDDCGRRLTAAGKLVIAVSAAHMAVTDLGKLLELTVADDAGYRVGDGAADAAASVEVARRALRDIRRICEAREVDLADQLEQLEADQHA